MILFHVELFLPRSRCGGSPSRKVRPTIVLLKPLVRAKISEAAQYELVANSSSPEVSEERSTWNDRQQIPS